MSRLTKQVRQSLTAQGFKVTQGIDRNGDPVTYIKTAGWKYRITGTQGSYGLEPANQSQTYRRLLQLLQEVSSAT